MASTITITTINALASTDLSTSLSIFCTIFLASLLILKALLNATEGAKKKFIARSLNIGIIPLLLTFKVIVALEVLKILS